MGVGHTFAEAFVKSQLAAGVRLPKSGKAFLSVRDEDKPKLVDVARTLSGLGFTLVHQGHRPGARGRGPRGPARQQGDGRPPNVVDMVRNKEISLIINTVEEDRRSVRDSWSIRNSALQAE